MYELTFAALLVVGLAIANLLAYKSSAPTKERSKHGL